MSGHATSLASHGIGTSATDLVVAPRSGGAGKRLVVITHGAGATPTGYTDPTGSPGSFLLANALAEAGYACVCTEMGGTQTWATDVVLTEFDAILAWAASNLPLAKVDKVHIWGASMGNLTLLRCAEDRPTKVACGLGNIPACSIDDFRDNNRLGTRDLINTAWGLTAGSTSATVAIPSRGNGLVRAQGGALAGFPWLGFYSSGDTVAIPSAVTALVTAIGSSASGVVVSSADHSDAPISAVANSAAYMRQLFAFLAAHD